MSCTSTDPGSVDVECRTEGFLIANVRANVRSCTFVVLTMYEEDVRGGPRLLTRGRYVGYYMSFLDDA